MNDLPSAVDASPASPQATNNPQVASRSPEVTSVAVVNFIVGAVDVLYGIGLLLGAGLLGPVPGLISWTAVGGVFAGLFAIIAALALIKSLLMVVAGWGVIKRRPWGRILTLVLGGLAVLAALGSLSPLNPLSLFIYAGYAAMVFAVLLEPRYAVEFLPGGAATGAMGVGDAGPTKMQGWIASRPLWLLVVVLTGTHLFCILAGAGLAGREPRDPNDIGKSELFEQEGQMAVGEATVEESEVNFPYPYAIAPNVELTIRFGNIQLSECKATGFKWKGKGTSPISEAHWRAKGIKAKKLPQQL